MKQQIKQLKINKTFFNEAVVAPEARVVVLYLIRVQLNDYAAL